MPQLPQLLLSVRRSRQTPEHAVRPVPQLITHVLPVQTSPPPHLVPQAPQLLLSVVRSRQTPVQLESPVAQLTAHLPAEQT